MLLKFISVKNGIQGIGIKQNSVTWTINGKNMTCILFCSVFQKNITLPIRKMYFVFLYYTKLQFHKNLPFHLYIKIGEVMLKSTITFDSILCAWHVPIIDSISVRLLHSNGCRIECQIKETSNFSLFIKSTYVINATKCQCWTKTIPNFVQTKKLT